MSMANELGWDGASPQPLRIAIGEAVLVDLKERLHKTRWPDEIADEPWAYGTDLGYLKALCAYWRDTYDWRKQEAELNHFKHYTAVIGGSAVHFIHERGEGPNPRPLLLPHGDRTRHERLRCAITTPSSTENAPREKPRLGCSPSHA